MELKKRCEEGDGVDCWKRRQRMERWPGTGCCEGAGAAACCAETVARHPWLQWQGLQELRAALEECTRGLGLHVDKSRLSMARQQAAQAQQRSARGGKTGLEIG